MASQVTQSDAGKMASLDSALVVVQECILFLVACLSSTITYLSILPDFILRASPSSKPRSAPLIVNVAGIPRPRRRSSATTAICYSPRNSMCEGVTLSFPLPPCLEPSRSVAPSDDEDEAVGLTPVLETADPFLFSSSSSKRNSGIFVEQIVVQEVVVVQL